MGDCTVRYEEPVRKGQTIGKNGLGLAKQKHITCVFWQKSCGLQILPDAVSAFFVFPVKRKIQMKKSKFAQYLTFYELFKIDSYCAVAIKWESWYNERRNAEKTSLDCSQLGRVGRE